MGSIAMLTEQKPKAKDWALRNAGPECVSRGVNQTLQ